MTLGWENAYLCSMTWDNEKYKHIGNISAFLYPYIGTGFGYIMIRGFMGMKLNAVGEIYFVVSSVAMIDRN